jgi:hypothetical protein
MCDGWFMHPPNEWMMNQMILRNIDTWMIRKLCDHCRKRRDDENEKDK